VLVAKTREGYRWAGAVATQVRWRCSEGAPGRLVGTGFTMTDDQADARPTEAIRPPWSGSGGPLARRVVQPLQAFLNEETSSALLLFTAAVVALVWVNSPMRESYETLWRTQVGIRIGDVGIVEDLRHWVNDGLMSLFFLVVGLEIKRELTTGELRDPRAAAVPVVAALGGMLVPAVIYLALNPTGASSEGWGIPMATDIAFALGVLTLAARSAPASLKPFLLTLAIVDDIGAIIVIALFYSGGVTVLPLALAAVLLAVIVVCQRNQVRAATVYVALGTGVWIAVFESGVHPAIAGVVLGLLTPAVPFQRPSAVSEEAHRIANETVDDPSPPDADAPQWLRLATLSTEAVSPLARVEAALHPWTSSLVVPLFALANAGIVLSGDVFADAARSSITLGIVLGLVVGKVAGVMFASALTVRTGIGRLPAGATWRHLLGVGAVAGIGFTVSLFITELAFGGGVEAGQAKVGVFTASVIAGLLGFVVFRVGSHRSIRSFDREGRPPG
jgi:NhaA family Na+:H+ antiporter